MLKQCKKCSSIDLYNNGACKPCARLRASNYRKLNPDKVKKVLKEYRLNNKEKIKAYRESNAEYLREYAKKYHSEHYDDSEFRDLSKQRTKKWYLENKQKAAEYSRKYKAIKKHELSEYGKLYYAVNKEKIKEYSRKWSLENREKINKTRAKRRKINPEIHRSSSRKRKSRIAVCGDLGIGLVDKLLKLQRCKCACCGLPLGKNYHMDHIIPLALGGAHTDDNIQLLRAKCNMQKSAKHPVDFMQSRGFLL